MFSPPLTAVKFVFGHFQPLTGLLHEESFSVAHLVSSFIDPAPLVTITGAVDTRSVRWFERVVNAHRDRIPPVLLDHRLCCAGSSAVSLRLAPIVRWIIAFMGERMPCAFGLKLAAGIGDVERVQQFLPSCTSDETIQAVKSAAEEGQLDTLKLLLASIERPEDHDDYKRLAHTAIKGGHQLCTEWLQSQSGSEAFPVFLSQRAIDRDDVESIRWLLKNSPARIDDVFVQAKARERVLHFLLDECKYSPRLEHFIDALVDACKAGSLKVMDVLWQHRMQCCGGIGSIPPKRFWGESEDDAHILKRLDDKGARAKKIHKILEAAILSGRMDVLAWVKCKKIASQGALQKFSTSTYGKVARQGHLEMLKFLHEQGGSIDWFLVMAAAAKQGQLHVCRWLYERRLYHQNLSAVLIEALSDKRSLIGFGESVTTERALQRTFAWLWDQLDDKKACCKRDVLLDAAHYGVIQIVQDIHEQDPTLDIHAAFIEAIQHGQLDVVRYLVRFGASVERKDIVPFIKNGNLEILIMLYERTVPRWGLKTLQFLRDEATKQHAFPMLLFWLNDKIQECQAMQENSTADAL